MTRNIGKTMNAKKILKVVVFIVCSLLTIGHSATPGFQWYIIIASVGVGWLWADLTMPLGVPQGSVRFPLSRFFASLLILLAYVLVLMRIGQTLGG